MGFFKVTNSAQDRAKKKVAEKAADMLKNNMLIGVGSGTTVNFFIAELAKKCQAGLQIKAAAASYSSEQLLKKYHIPLIPNCELNYLDLTIDGADFIDLQNNMIKGGGGALLREKIIASLAKELVIIVDSSKKVTSFKGHILPVEISQIAYKATMTKLKNFCSTLNLRKIKTDLEVKNSAFVTDNGNYIVDLVLGKNDDLAQLNIALKEIPGVAETGLFLNLAPKVLIANIER